MLNFMAGRIGTAIHNTLLVGRRGEIEFPGKKNISSVKKISELYGY